MAESVCSAPERELPARRNLAAEAKSHRACFSYIEGWYNPVWLHSGEGYRSPFAYEQERLESANARG